VTSYVLRRLVVLVPTWLGISLAAFALASLAPGDPAQLILDRQSDEPPTELQLQQFRERTGLDDPMPVQYGRFVLGLFRGELGTSFRSGEPVLHELAERVPATLQITLPAFVLAVVLAVSIGVLSAMRRNSFADHGSRLAALMSDSVPTFVLAYGLILLLAVQAGLLPVAGRGTWQHLVLPVLTLALGTTASLMRLTRSSLLEVLGEEYVRTARAKGLPPRTVVLRHALRNALLPVVTVGGIVLAGFVTGTVIVETIFAWPGVGTFLVDAIFDRDYPVIQGFVVFTGTVFVLVNLVVDLLHAALDPRVRAAP
jgi:ABC-type dipeptide/oligopeptide/nickel transport system permease component